MSYRRIQIIGNVGQAPEVTLMNNGAKVANFSVAVGEKFTNRAGEKVEATTWFRVNAWQNGETGIVDGLIKPYVGKGQSVFIDGVPEIRQYEKDGARQFAFQIRIGALGTTLQLLGPRKGGERGEAPAANGSFLPDSEEEPGTGSRRPLADDDVPF
jgi:single-strand DNA-binding protein